MVAVGVLCLQGDIVEHAQALASCGAQAVDVRRPEDLARVQGLIIPGGESTTIGRLMRERGLDEAIVAAAQRGMPVWGTCAGAILLATDIAGSDQPRLSLMRMRVARNAYGRQAESFETSLDVEGLGDVPAVFIRAPVIESCEGRVLARHQGTPVVVVEKNLMASTFHPELTGDARVHGLFLRMVSRA